MDPKKSRVYVTHPKQVDFIRLVWVQTQRFIYVIHRSVIRLRVRGDLGKAIQLALGSPAECGPHRVKVEL